MLFTIGKAKSWLALSLEVPNNAYSLNSVGPNSSLDLVFVSLADLRTWVIGLQLLTPVSARSISPGRLAWMRAILKINHIGFNAYVTDKSKDWTTTVNTPVVV